MAFDLRRKLLVLIAAVAPVGGAEAGSVLNQLNANNDHGFWFDQTINARLPCGWSVSFQAEQRWGSDYRKFWYESNQLIFQCDVTKVFNVCSDSLLKLVTIGPGYNLTRRDKKNTLGHYHWLWVNRYLLEANLGLEWREWQMNHRLRGGYHQFTRHHYKDFANFRYRLAVAAPWKWTCYHITPYVSNEWFFKNNTYHKTHPDGLVGGWNQNRFRIGLNADLASNLSAAIYWQWRALKQKPDTHPRWKNNYIIGLSLSLDL